MSNITPDAPPLPAHCHVLSDDPTTPLEDEDWPGPGMVMVYNGQVVFVPRTTGYEWTLTKRDRTALERARDDFRQGLPGDRIVECVCVYGAPPPDGTARGHCGHIPWKEITKGECHPWGSLELSDRPLAIAVCGDGLRRTDWDRLCHTCTNALIALRDSGCPWLPADWAGQGIGGLHWLAFVIEIGVNNCAGFRPMEYLAVHNTYMNDGRIRLNFTHPSFDGPPGTYAPPWEQETLAFPHDVVLKIEDIMTASWMAMDYILRQMVFDQPDEATGVVPKSRKGEPGQELWRRAQKKMLARLTNGTLPKSVRGTFKLIDETYNTTLRAAQESPTLAAHYGLKQADDGKPTGGSLLDELVHQADGRSREWMKSMTPSQRRDAESALEGMDPQDAVKLVETMAADPETLAAMRGTASLDVDEQDPDADDYVPKKARRRDHAASRRYDAGD